MTRPDIEGVIARAGDRPLNIVDNLGVQALARYALSLESDLAAATKMADFYSGGSVRLVADNARLWAEVRDLRAELAALREVAEALCAQEERGVLGARDPRVIALRAALARRTAP